MWPSIMMCSALVLSMLALSLTVQYAHAEDDTEIARLTKTTFLPVPELNTVLFPNFFDTSIFANFGAARRFRRKAIRLTTGAALQRGLTLMRTPVFFLDADFHRGRNTTGPCKALKWVARFSYRMAGPGADGLAFVIQSNLRNLGGTDGALGYGKPVRYHTPSLAIELDNLKNTWDPYPNHVGVLRKYTMTSAATASLKGVTTLDDAKTQWAWVEYDGKKLSVFVARQPKKPTRPVLSYAINLCDELVSPGKYVGFSASTSKASGGVHDILSFSLSVQGSSRCPSCGSVYNPEMNVKCCPPFQCCNGVCLAPTELCGGTTCCGQAASGRVCWGAKCCSVTSLCTAPRGLQVCCPQVGNSTCCL